MLNALSPVDQPIVNIHVISSKQSSATPASLNFSTAVSFVFLGVGMLLVNYTGAIALPIVFPEHFHAVRMVVAHVGLASKLLYEAFQLHKHNYTPAAINRLYSWVWKLLYAEYILLPFI